MTEYIWDRGIGTGARKTCKNCSWTLDVTQTWSPPSTVLVTDRCNIGCHKGQFGNFCLLLVRDGFAIVLYRLQITNYNTREVGSGLSSIAAITWEGCFSRLLKGRDQAEDEWRVVPGME